MLPSPLSPGSGVGAHSSQLPTLPQGPPAAALPLLCRPLQLIPPGSAHLRSQTSPSSSLSHPRESSLQQPPLTWKRPPALLFPNALLCSRLCVPVASTVASCTGGGWREGVAWPGPQRSEQSSGERAFPHPTPPHLILPSLSLSPSGPTRRPTVGHWMSSGISHPEP